MKVGYFLLIVAIIISVFGVWKNRLLRQLNPKVEIGLCILLTITIVVIGIFRIIRQEKSARKQQELALQIDETKRVLSDVKVASEGRNIPQSLLPEIVSVLAGNEGYVGITTVLGDQEAFQFAKQLKSAFTKAGWEVNGVSQSVYGNPVKGIHIVVQSRQYPKRVNAIVKVLSMLELAYEESLNPKLESDKVELIIGGR